MFLTKSLPNIPKASASPDFWISQLRLLYSLFEENNTLSPRKIKEMVSQNEIPLNLKWLSDYLRLGVGLGFLERTSRGIYRIQPKFSFMLQSPQSMTEHEHSLMIELILSIPQCQVILSRVDYLDTIQNAFIMNCIRDPEIDGFDDPSIRTALTLLIHYGFLGKQKQRNSKNRLQVSYLKIVACPDNTQDDPFKDSIAQELSEYISNQSESE